MCMGAVDTCPNYKSIEIGIIPDACVRCRIFKKFLVYRFYGRVGLIIGALLFIITTGYIYR